MEEVKKPTAREAMLAAIQQYAEEWKEGKVTMLSSPARTAVYLAMDGLEAEAMATGTEKVLQELWGFINSEERTSDHRMELAKMVSKIAVMRREAEVRSCRG
jgi:nitrate/TMAO reductase-like tetraheme cytochrome c subunit